MNRRLPAGLRLLVATIGYAFVFVSPAAATKLCPGLPVAAGDECVCCLKVHGSTADAGLQVVITNTAASTSTHSDVTLPPGALQCYLLPNNSPGPQVCGCKVTGEASGTRVSFSSVDPSTFRPSASVECRP